MPNIITKICLSRQSFILTEVLNIPKQFLLRLGLLHLFYSNMRASVFIGVASFTFALTSKAVFLMLPSRKDSSDQVSKRVNFLQKHEHEF